jgi:hypothetical protein
MASTHSNPFLASITHLRRGETNERIDEFKQNRFESDTKHDVLVGGSKHVVS